MKSEFEEKTYESAFNLELKEKGRRGGATSYAPGQVAEGELGFDTAWMIGATHPFWKMVSGTHRQGADVSDRTQHKFSSRLYNLFIQYKRSEYISRANGNHYGHFNGPYYKFKFDNPPQQLGILKELEIHLENKAHVLYAAPEFHTVDELLRATDDGTVISQSVLARPQDLGADHTTFNFKTGHQFLQNPNPEQVEGINAEDFLRGLNSFEGEPQILQDALESISQAIFSIEEWEPIWRHYEPFIESTWLDQETSSRRKLARDYLAISSFSAVYGISWILAGHPTEL